MLFEQAAPLRYTAICALAIVCANAIAVSHGLRSWADGTSSADQSISLAAWADGLSMPPPGNQETPTLFGPPPVPVNLSANRRTDFRGAPCGPAPAALGITTKPALKNTFSAPALPVTLNLPLDFRTARASSEPIEVIESPVPLKLETPVAPSAGGQPTAANPNLCSVPPSTNLPSIYRLAVADAIRLGIENNKDVVVLGYIPALDATDIETTKAPYDPVSGVAAYGGQSDVQVRSEIQSFGSTADFLDTDFLRPLDRPNDLYLRRHLYSGGQVELGFSTDYEDYFPQGDQLLVNPGWDSALNLRIDQPLLRGRGTDSTTAPIRIAQAKQKKSQFVFMGEIRELSRDIEIAYWEFAGAERSHQVLQQLVKQAETIVDEESQRRELGQSALPNILQAKSLLEEFRVLEAQLQQDRDIAESNLRQIMGIQVDGEKCVTTHTYFEGLQSLPFTSLEAEAAVSPVMPWEALLQTALQRPEVLAQNASIRAARIYLCRAKNHLQPDLSARVNYSVNGLDQSLGNSFRTIARHEYNTWGVGLIYERPFGQRSAKADMRRAELTVAQEIAQLDKIEHNILHALCRAEEKLHSSEGILVLQENRVAIAEEQLEAYSALYRENRVDLFLRLESERTLAAARLELTEAWKDKQLAVVERNFEANLTSLTYQFEVSPSPAGDAEDSLPQ